MNPLEQAIILEWSKDSKRLTDGRVVESGNGCLFKPEAQDRVLVMTTGSETRVVLVAILERQDSAMPMTLECPEGMRLQTNLLKMDATKMQINTTHLLSASQHHCLVEGTHTETSRLKVTQSDSIVREVGSLEDRVGGTLFQRMSNWLSTTATDVRMKAKSFLFE